MSYKRAALLAFLVLSCAHQDDGLKPVATSQSARRYTVLMAGNTAGTQVVTKSGDEVVVDFEFNDRGRGPKTHTVMRLQDGKPVFLETKGNDYLKQQIEERFVVENGLATWKNTAEAGEEKGSSLYASMYGPPEELGVIVTALMRSGGKLPLAGGGEGSARKVGELTLDGKRVSAYAVSGFGFTPFEVWLDDE